MLNIQTIAIINKALDLVLLLRYSNGEVIDQYLSSDRVSKFRIDAVLAV